MFATRRVSKHFFDDARQPRNRLKIIGPNEKGIKNSSPSGVFDSFSRRMDAVMNNTADTIRKGCIIFFLTFWMAGRASPFGGECFASWALHLRELTVSANSVKSLIQWMITRFEVLFFEAMAALFIFSWGSLCCSAKEVASTFTA